MNQLDGKKNPPIVNFASQITRRMYRLRGTGIPRLADCVRRWFAHSKWQDIPVRTTHASGFEMICKPSTHMGGRIIFRGDYTADILGLVSRLVNPSSTFVDIGANQGEVALHAANLCRIGKIIAFEPIAIYADLLDANVRLNGFDNVTVRRVAISNENTTAEIFHSLDRFPDGASNEGLASLAQRPGVSQVFGQVAVRTLDSEMRQIGSQFVDCVKIDIEGFELQALEGARATLITHKPHLILEWNELAANAAGYSCQAILSYLHALEYEVFSSVGEMLNPDHTPSLLPPFADIVAIHPTRSNEIRLPS